MYIITSFLFLAVLANKVICTHKPPCFETKNRLEKTLMSTLTNVIKGNGTTTDCFDPLPLPSLIGNFSILQYTCCNSTMTGLKSCRVTKFKVSPDGKTAEFVLDCPSFDLHGDVDFDGYFLYLPSSGNGGYSVLYGRHLITVYVQLKHIEECTNDYHIQFCDFSLQPKAKGKTKYKFEHVFCGEEDVTHERTKFANEHSDELVYFSQGPVLNPVVENLLQIANKELAKMCHK